VNNFSSVTQYLEEQIWTQAVCFQTPCSELFTSFLVLLLLLFYNHSVDSIAVFRLTPLLPQIWHHCWWSTLGCPPSLPRRSSIIVKPLNNVPSSFPDVRRRNMEAAPCDSMGCALLPASPPSACSCL
jgi:hypothetical protein